MKKIVIILNMLIIMLLTSCYNDTSFNSTLINSNKVSKLEYDYNDTLIYNSNFAYDLSSFYANNCYIENTKFEDDFVLKVSNRNNWWDFARIKLSLEKDSYYLFEASIYQISGDSGSFFISLDYFNNSTNENANKAVKSYDGTSDTWHKLKGIFNIYDYSDFYLNIYTVNNNDYYIKDIKVTKILRDSSYVTNYEDKICDLATNNNMMFGALAYKDALLDENYNNYLKSHFNLYSCGNYLFLDELKSKEEYSSSNPWPKSYYDECDMYYELAKSNNAKIRGHALVHDGTTYDWFFREKYDTSLPYVDAKTLRLRLEHYIEEVITHYETLYPGISYSFDVSNEGLCYDTNYADSEYYVRKSWEDGRENMFYTILGKDYFKLIYAYARKYAGNNIKLFYNDYASFDDNANKFVKVASWLNDGNPIYDENGNEILSYDGTKLIDKDTILIDGVGIEGYFGIAQKDYANNGGFALGDSNGFVADAVRTYNKAGLEVQFTECTIINYDESVLSQQNQARLTYLFVKMLINLNKELTSEGNKGITALTMWNTVDDPFLIDGEYSYGLAGTNSGLLDIHYYPKYSFYAIISAFKEEEYPFD